MCSASLDPCPLPCPGLTHSSLDRDSPSQWCRHKRTSCGLHAVAGALDRCGNDAPIQDRAGQVRGITGTAGVPLCVRQARAAGTLSHHSSHDRLCLPITALACFVSLLDRHLPASDTVCDSAHHGAGRDWEVPLCEQDADGLIQLALCRRTDGDRRDRTAASWQCALPLLDSTLSRAASLCRPCLRSFP